MKKAFYFFILFLSSLALPAQNRVINTAVPFLLINPGGQSMGIADIGVVAASCYYESGLTQNPALLSRNEKVIGFKLSYKPWLRQYYPDIYMGDFQFYYAFNKKNALAYSYNLFDLGNLYYNGSLSSPTYSLHATDSYHSLRYAHSFNEHLSIGIGVKYIVSDIVTGLYFNGATGHKGKAIAGDIGLDYHREIMKKETYFIRYDFGASILNMGNKIKYFSSDIGGFMPMQLCVGTLWTFNKDINEKTRYCLDVAYQFEKLLVPTPPQYGYDSNGNRIIIKGKDPDVSVAQGALQSFYDAPDGANEEFKEIVHKVGIENRWEFNKKSSLAVRLGYLREWKIKGDRKYVNAGIGIKIRPFFIDGGIILFYNQYGKLMSVLNFDGLNSFCINIGFKWTLKKKEK